MQSRETIYIDGRWVESTGSSTIAVVNAHTEALIATVPDGTTQDMDRAVEAARRAFDGSDWAWCPLEERLEIMRRFADAYQKRIPELAATISAQNGTPMSFAVPGQAAGPWAMLNAFLAVADSFPWETTRAGMIEPSITVLRQPVGVVAAIVPWNVPQFVTMSKVAPALIAGCTVVLKPSPETPLDAYLLVEALEEAGLPPGVLNMVPAGREAGEHLVRSPGVDKVAFTGSTAAGRAIAAICGQDLKRCSLELGGKSAAIILDDADLALTAQGLKFASVLNSGQACTNQTRILASRRRYDDVVAAVAEAVGQMQVGDPGDPATEIGPMVSQVHRQRVESYIELGTREGASVVLGGTGRPDGLDHGWYVRPTVFAGADNDMRICREEIFGPVVAVIPYEDVDDALRIANDSAYGLAGSVWTSDVEKGSALARRVRTGTIGVNQYTADFLTPFGGFKSSGLGREFGPEGLSAYTEIQTLFPPPSGAAPVFAG